VRTAVGLVLRQHHPSEGAAAQRPHDHEVIYGLVLLLPKFSRLLNVEALRVLRGQRQKLLDLLDLGFLVLA